MSHSAQSEPTLSLVSREHFQESLAKVLAVIDEVAGGKILTSEDEKQVVGRVNGLIEWMDLIEELDSGVIFAEIVFPYSAWAASDLVPRLDQRAEGWRFARGIFWHAERVFGVYSAHAALGVDVGPLKSDFRMLRRMILSEGWERQSRLEEKQAALRELEQLLEEYDRDESRKSQSASRIAIFYSEHDPIYGTRFYDADRRFVASGALGARGDITYWDRKGEVIAYYFSALRSFSYQGVYREHRPELPDVAHFTDVHWSAI